MTIVNQSCSHGGVAAPHTWLLSPLRGRGVGGSLSFQRKSCFPEASKSERLMSWSPACEVSIDAVFGSTGAETRGRVGLPAYNQVMLDIAAQSEGGGRNRSDEERSQWVTG